MVSMTFVTVQWCKGHGQPAVLPGLKHYGNNAEHTLCYTTHMPSGMLYLSSSFVSMRSVYWSNRCLMYVSVHLRLAGQLAVALTRTTGRCCKSLR